MVNFDIVDIDYFKINENKIINWLDNIISIENKILGDLSYIFCSDNYLLEINKKYLNHNYFTDVITFDYSEQKIISGDIFISIERISDNSSNYSVTFNNELLRVMIHGVLHLLGYEDINSSDKLIMTSKEDRYLNMYKNGK